MLEVVVFEAEENKSNKVRLALKERYDGVELVIIDEDGDEDDTILSINNDGKMTLWSCISPSHGLALDEDGQIEID